jgi:hypothetical protein
MSRASLLVNHLSADINLSMLEVNETPLIEGPYTELYVGKYSDKDIVLKRFKSSVDRTENDAYDFERECEFLR